MAKKPSFKEVLFQEQENNLKTLRAAFEAAAADKDPCRAAMRLEDLHAQVTEQLTALKRMTDAHNEKCLNKGKVYSLGLQALNLGGWSAALLAGLTTAVAGPAIMGAAIASVFVGPGISFYAGRKEKRAINDCIAAFTPQMETLIADIETDISKKVELATAADRSTLFANETFMKIGQDYPALSKKFIAALAQKPVVPPRKKPNDPQGFKI